MKTTSYYLSHVFIGVMHLRPFSHFIIFARVDSDFRIFSKSNFNVLTNTYILYENNFLLFVTCFYWSCGISNSLLPPLLLLECSQYSRIIQGHLKILTENQIQSYVMIFPLRGQNYEGPPEPFGWIFWTMAFYNHKKFTTRSI